MKAKLFLLFCLLIFSQACLANNGCPDGYYFTGRMIQGQGVSYPECAPDQQAQAPAQQQPPAPRGHWETRWGAIAIDGLKGRLGGVTNHKSKYAAEQAAIKECYSRGGGQGSKGCKIYYTYYNQCAAIAWGDTKYVAGGRDAIEDASQDAMQSCSKVSPECVVVYNACSSAEWISY
jgi:Domain of unknown function (DUF4189)